MALAVKALRQARSFRYRNLWARAHFQKVSWCPDQNQPAGKHTDSWAGWPRCSARPSSVYANSFPGDTEAHFPTLRKSPEEMGKTGQSFTGVLASAPRLSGGVQGAHGASENLQAHCLVCVRSMPLTSFTSSKGTPKRSWSSRGSFCWVWWLSSATSYEKFLFEYIVIHF